MPSSAFWLHALVRYAQRAGVDREKLLAAASLRSEDLQQPWAEVSEQQESSLWCELERRALDPLLGVRFGATFSTPERFGIVGFLARAGQTWEAALHHLVRYHRLLGTSHAWLESDGERVAVAFEMSPSLLALHHPGEARLASMLTGWRRASNGHERPVSVMLPRAPQDDAPEVERILGASVSWNASAYRIVWTREQVERRHLASDAHSRRFFENLANHALARIDAADPLAPVRQAVLEELESGEVSLAAVSRKLAVSPRTLQRRLADHRSSFSDLIDQARRQRALSLLETTDRSLEEIADAVGFHDASALRRACRRWMGQPPKAVRARARISL